LLYIIIIVYYSKWEMQIYLTKSFILQLTEIPFSVDFRKGVSVTSNTHIQWLFYKYL
jgi:hypothetical protein